MAEFGREISVTTLAGDDVPIKIPLKSLLEHILCTVCRSTLDNPAITNCGHRYCFACIKECVGRRHECPVCRNPLTMNDVVVDKGFEELIGTVIKEAQNEEKLYLQDVASATSESFFLGRPRTSSASLMEMVLRKHLKQTLKVHELYHQEILSEYRRSQSRATRENQLKIDHVLRKYPHDPDHPERVRLLNVVQKEWEQNQQSSAAELARVENLLASAYDRYLTEYLPSPSTIPITVTLSVPERNFSASDVILKPDITMALILKKLSELMAAEGLEVVSFPSCEELQISLLNPFTSRTEEEEGGGDQCAGGREEGACGGGSEGLTSLKQTTLHGDCRPVLEYGLKPGCEIQIQGKIVLEGEQPKACFAATFTPGKQTSVDYFTCRTCGNMNWVCQNCAGGCHAGHDIVPHRMNHRPTWACCYCRRKGVCKISPL